MLKHGLNCVPVSSSVQVELIAYISATCTVHYSLHVMNSLALVLPCNIAHRSEHDDYPGRCYNAIIIAALLALTILVLSFVSLGSA